MSNFSRRHFVGVGAASALAAKVLSAQAPEETIFLTNGRIHTMDATNTIANSVTIRNRRFVAINGATPTGPGVRTINLGGKTAVPGLIEPHIHSVSLANRPGYHTILENTTSIREVQEALAARRRETPESVDHLDGWLASEPMGRASPSHAHRARRRRTRPARAPL